MLGYVPQLMLRKGSDKCRSVFPPLYDVSAMCCVNLYFYSTLGTWWLCGSVLDLWPIGNEFDLCSWKLLGERVIALLLTLVELYCL